MADFGDVRFTDEQFAVIKSMVKLAETVADQILHIMQNHGLDRVEGCRLMIDVDPSSDLLTREIVFGSSVDKEAGQIELTRGKDEKQYAPCGSNSPEYEVLFATPEVAERMRRLFAAKVPVCSGGLWFGDNGNDPPMDSRGREVRFDDCPAER